MANVRLKGYILEAVENQIKDNEPQCVNETLERLVSIGCTEKKAKEIQKKWAEIAEDESTSEELDIYINYKASKEELVPLDGLL